MDKYKRSRYLVLTFEELDKDGSGPKKALLVLTSILTGQHILASQDELKALCSVPSHEWVDQSRLEDIGFSCERVSQLAELGILVADDDSEYLKSLRMREELLEASHWPPCAALFHLLNQHAEGDRIPPGKVVDTAQGEEEAEQGAARFIALHGMSPPALVSRPDAIRVDELSWPVADSPLTDILGRRRTCRYFEPGRSLSSKALSHILRWVFGPIGVRRFLGGQLELLVKTSPSGGSLHPLEAYPLIFSGEGFEPGLYHYQAGSHSLELLKKIDEEQLRNLSVYFAEGQQFVGTCAVLVILVARFNRNFWKYRERENSYAVVLQDAGHLSQTFQLVATELDLGTFYTAAINGEAISRFLDLPYPAEAPIGLLGVGERSSTSPKTLEPEPFGPEAQGRR